jgi:hypothetical protein
MKRRAGIYDLGDRKQCRSTPQKIVTRVVYVASMNFLAERTDAREGKNLFKRQSWT